MEGLLYPFLWLLSRLYAGLIALRNYFYDRGVFTIRTLKVPVICVGNLTTGGTGKSPWVISMVKYYQSQGLEAGVISRGYGGDFKGVMQVTGDTLPSQAGDEPLMIYQQTGAPVFVGRDRFAAGTKLLDAYDVDVLIMDDGFQHRSLNRNINIVLFDSLAGAKPLKLLPVGRLREPLQSLERADLVVFNKWTLASPMQQESLAQTVRFQPRLNSTYKHKGFQALVGGATHEALKNPKVALACGVANPQAVLQSLRSFGVEPVKTFFYKDHMSWTASDVESLIQSFDGLKGVDLIITEKDAVKLRRYASLFSGALLKVWVMPVQVDLMGAEDILYKVLARLPLKRGSS